MLLNCGVGEDSESPLDCKEIQPVHPKKDQLGVHWKDWYWSWNSNTLATYAKRWLIWKDRDAGKDREQEEKGTTEDEMDGIIDSMKWM